MSFGFKIRFLLLLLGICCIATAISLKHSITDSDLLNHEAKELQENLTVKEQIVYSFLNEPKQIEKAKQYHLNEKFALDFISLYRNNGINILTYENNELRFWSSFKVIPSDISLLKEGSSVVQFPNGWYNVIKKTEGDYSFVFLILIQSQYPKENQYFKNEISRDLSASDALTIASFADKNIHNIKGIHNEYLFAVKLKSKFLINYYTKIEIALWLLGLLSICLFFNSICSWIAKKGYLAVATILLTAIFFSIRMSDLEYGWFSDRFDLEIFSPKIYAESFFMPSLGGFLLNVLSISWVVLFIYNHKESYRFPGWIAKNKFAGFLIHLFFLAVLSAMALITDDVFFGLIYNSKINFQVNNIINLDWLSWVSITILCLVWFNIYMIALVFMLACKRLNVSNKERLFLFLIAFSLFFIYKLFTTFTVYFIVYGLFLFILGWYTYKQNRKFSIGLFAGIFFCLAFNTAIKYIRYTDIKERSLRAGLAPKLQSSEDPYAVIALDSLEKVLVKDKFVVNYYKFPALNKPLVLKNHIAKKYLDGYLSRYDYKIYNYNRADSAISSEDIVPLYKFKDKVEEGSIKIARSSFFYKVNDTFGYQDYFGIIPVMSEGNMLGTLVVELKSKPYNRSSRFMDILSDSKIKTEEEYAGYSYAFYNYGMLLNQSGNFTYPIENINFSGKVGEISFINDYENGYNHLVYMPSPNKVVVVSKEKVNYVDRLGTYSFFFLVFIIFSSVLYGLVWMVKNLEDERVGWFNINRSLMINANKILYRTRIQVSVVFSVVATLLIVGWTTFSSIRREYRGQQEEQIRDKVIKMQVAFEKQIYNTGKIRTDEEARADFNNFADVNGVDLNLYSTSGDLLMTTYPKLFQYGLISEKMATLAYVYLNKLQRSEYVNNAETMGSLTYASAYAPIRNADYQTIAYINIPNYTNEAEFSDKIGLFVNTLINIYALVFVAIGVLAVFLANQITSPLTFIQESLRRTKIGQKNEPIVWRRHDEIGSLIREYNNMIAALEESALKLARSERESAWREMAKQVAHEIKNPLTPLKLGVQLLEKSWKENDPHFEKKFKRFSQSFIEQIESLSNIASEFSNFAKMPETKLEQIDLLQVIAQAREVFTNTQGVQISILDHTSRPIQVMGDKDQLLRAFNNLFKNAIEAALEDQVCVISVLLTNDNKEVFAEVNDNGKGIPSEQHAKIFVPNFTTKSSGTGLGLAFVKQAVENAGGSVSFRSMAHAGTSFYIKMPLV